MVLLILGPVQGLGRSLNVLDLHIFKNVVVLFNRSLCKVLARAQEVACWM